jgi:hypothetical protein
MGFQNGFSWAFLRWTGFDRILFPGAANSCERLTERANVELLPVENRVIGVMADRRAIAAWEFIFVLDGIKPIAARSCLWNPEHLLGNDERDGF